MADPTVASTTGRPLGGIRNRREVDRHGGFPDWTPGRRYDPLGLQDARRFAPGHEMSELSCHDVRNENGG